MFKVPSTGRPEGKRGAASTREWVRLGIMAVTVLTILGWWGVRRGRRKHEEGSEGPRGVEEMQPEDPSQVSRQEVLESFRRDMPAEQPEPAAEEHADFNPGLEGWREPRDADTTSPEDAEWLVQSGRAQEEEEAKFLPLLESFEPLVPDAVRAYRARLIDRIPAGAEAGFSLPGEAGVRFTVVAADSEGLTARAEGGPERRFTWDDLPLASLYEAAKGIARVDGPNARAPDVFYLVHLAGLLGRGDEAATYTKRLVELDARLAERAASGPATSLNYAILDEFSWAWDDPQNPTPKAATSLRGDAPSIFHVYRYLRTLGADGLPAARVGAPYEHLVGRPRTYRGEVLAVKGRFIKRYKSTRWVRIPGQEKAGIQDLDFCFIREIRSGHVFLISVPQDTRVFSGRDMVALVGVYIRRWPYRSEGKWEWMPWLAALELERFEIEAGGGIRNVGLAVLVLAVLGVIVVFVVARRESGEAGRLKKLRRAKQRSQRDRIRQKVAEAGKPPEDKGGEKRGA